ncbi:MAG: TetR/AcrR family transcriptional regulator [Clostridia bacterium]|nr:TetR/AcrR family transcriptional regulator [Clostridia bacterium]
MGAKGDNARARIISCAHDLFSQKGYCATTMQDISEASGFSRGGLYRHFASTEEIFLELIKSEQERAFAALENALHENIKPNHILRGFLLSRMQAISQPTSTFDIAVSEFAANSAKGKQALIKRAEDSVEILSKLIVSGNEMGVFTCDSPTATASHILWVIEGMSRHARLIPITPSQIDEQIAQIELLLKK